MAPFSINSIIATVVPGLAPAAPLSTGAPAPTSTPTEPGVVFTRTGAGENRSGSIIASGYTRRDALGQRTSAPQEGGEPQSGKAGGTGANAPEKKITTAPQSAQGPRKKPNGEFLTRAEMALIRELQRADQAVKAHEMAHLASAGGYAKGGASYSYQRGPDGQNYAVGGEVQVDTGKEATPEATIQKMQIIRQAALAPVDPSPQDQQVAAHATLQISEAFKELQQAQLVQLSQAQKGNFSQGAADDAKDNGDTARGIYQDAAAPALAPAPGAPTVSPAGAKRNYAAYTRPLPPPAQTGRQGLYRIA